MNMFHGLGGYKIRTWYLSMASSPELSVLPFGVLSHLTIEVMTLGSSGRAPATYVVMPS